MKRFSQTRKSPSLITGGTRGNTEPARRLSERAVFGLSEIVKGDLGVAIPCRSESSAVHLVSFASAPLLRPEFQPLWAAGRTGEQAGPSRAVQGDDITPERLGRPSRAPLPITLAEERQDALRCLVGDRQRLNAQLLLHLERLKAGRNFLQIRVNQGTDP
jgi:hypothetical protein